MPNDWNKPVKAAADIKAAPKHYQELVAALHRLNLQPILEYEFDKQPGGKGRKWRLDIYIPKLRLGIEVDGVGSRHHKFGSRHLSPGGHATDNEKAAAALGRHGISTLRCSSTRKSQRAILEAVEARLEYQLARTIQAVECVAASEVAPQPRRSSP